MAFGCPENLTSSAHYYYYMLWVGSDWREDAFLGKEESFDVPDSVLMENSPTEHFMDFYDSNLSWKDSLLLKMKEIRTGPSSQLYRLFA